MEVEPSLYNRITSALLEQLMVTWFERKTAFHGAHRSLLRSQESATDPYPHSNPVYNLISCFFNINFKIFLQSTHRSPK